METFDNFLYHTIGSCTIPLVYVMQENENPPAGAPKQANGMPHSMTYGLVEEDLVSCALHNHPLFCDDNLKVYFFLEEAT